MKLCIVKKVIYDNIFSFKLMILKKILIKIILEIITAYMKRFKIEFWMFI